MSNINRSYTMSAQQKKASKVGMAGYVKKGKGSKKPSKKGKRGGY